MLARMYSMVMLREDVCARGIWYDRLLVDDEFLGFAACGLRTIPRPKAQRARL